MSGTTTPTYDNDGYLGDDPNLTRLLDNVQSVVPGAILSQVNLAAWNAIEEFYLRSTVRRELLQWQMQPGVQQIDFNPYDAEWLVSWVLAVTGLASYRIEAPGTLIDRNFPYERRYGSVLLALKPVSFKSLPASELWVQWFETILAGTLFKLFEQPAKPWSSLPLAQIHGKRFRLGIMRARGIAQQNFTSNGSSWVFPRSQGFANGRRKN